MPAFSIVGLPDAAVQEAKDRVRSAIQNSGFPFPRSRITVNLAPAGGTRVTRTTSAKSRSGGASGSSALRRGPPIGGGHSLVRWRLP